MSRRFCCCIPVRAGVFITSLLAFLVSGAAAGLFIFVLIKTNDKDDAKIANLTSQQHTALIVVAALYSVIALSSLFGFIGSVIRKRGFVAIYSTMSFILFLIQSAGAGWVLYEIWRHDGADLQCTTTDTNGKTEDCDDIIKHSRVGITIVLVLQWLIQLYICVVIKRYVQQLDEEQSYNRTTGYVDSAFKMGPTNPTYYAHQPLDQGQGLLAPKVDYPYSDPQHSHGSYGHGGL